MEDINDYWKMMEYPPLFTNIDWNDNQSSTNSFIPMEYDQQKIPPSYQHQPFQRRRSSSVDLPINPLYSNTNRYMMGNNETTIHEEDQQQLQFEPLQQQQQQQQHHHDFPQHPFSTMRVGSSAVEYMYYG